MVLENVWAFVDLSRQCYYSTCNVRPRTLDKLIEWLNATGKTKQIWILGSWASLRRRHCLPCWTTHNGIKKRIAHSTVSTHIITSPMIEGGGMQGMLMWHDKWKGVRVRQSRLVFWPLFHLPCYINIPCIPPPSIIGDVMMCVLAVLCAIRFFNPLCVVQ